MRKTSLLLTALLLLTFIGSAQPVENSSSSANPGLTSASPFYPAEVFVESLEVKLAGFIGGPDLKSKALANNAEERVAEADKLIEMNRSEKAAETIQRYSNTINQSRDLAARGQDQELQEKLENISDKNTEKLRKVKDRVPSKAKEAIEKAINKSQKPSELENRANRSEKPDKPDLDKNLPVEKEIKNETGLANSSNSKGDNISIKPNKTSETKVDSDNTVREFDDQGLLPSSEVSAGSSSTGKITENKSITGLR